MSLYYMANARDDGQRDYMRELESQGVCLFCADGMASSPEQPVVHRTAHWTVTPNRFPYRGAKVHLLLVPDQHVTDMLDLPPAARVDFFDALEWIRDRYALDYYGLAVRNGDCSFTGGTIRHVHAHVVVGDGAADRPVRVKLSSRPE